MALFFIHGEAWNGGGTDTSYLPPGIRDLVLTGPFRAKTPASGQDADMAGVAWPPFVAALASWKDRMVLVDGLPMVGVDLNLQGPNHGHGFAALSAVGRASTPSGITIDQHVAGVLGRDTPVKSLQFGFGYRVNSAEAVDNFASGPGAGVAHAQTPAALLARMVGGRGSGSMGSVAAPTPMLGSRLFDLVRDEVRRLERGLASEEKAQLAEYLTSMEAYQKKEQSLATQLQQTGCTFPGTVPVPSGVPGRSSARAAFDSMFRLSTLALKCGVTNVIGATLGNSPAHGDLDMFVNDYEPHTHHDVALRSLAPVSMGWVDTMLKDLGPLADSMTVTIVPANGLGVESVKSHHGHNVTSAFIFDGPRALRTGARFLRIKRNLADLYTTLAGVLGAPVDKFNNTGAGRINELLA
jgi:hypothetical protein